MPKGVYIQTAEHIRNAAEARRGYRHSEETKLKMKEAKRLNPQKFSQETRKKFSEAHKGEKHWNWKGGVSSDKKHNSELYKIWCKKYRKSKGRKRKSYIDKIERLRFHRKKYKALKKGGGKLSIETIQLVYEDNIKKFGTLTCYLCLEPIKFKEDHLEHKIPLSKGGNNLYHNLAVACKKCNLTKHAKTEKEYRVFSIFNFVKRIAEMEERMAQGLNDLEATVSSLVTVVSQVKTMVSGLQAQIAQLQATIAAGGDNDAEVESQAQAIKAQVDTLNGIVNPPAPAAPAAPAS